MFICAITILRWKEKIHRGCKKRKHYSLEASGRNKMQSQQTPGRLIEKIRYTKLSFSLVLCARYFSFLGFET